METCAYQFNYYQTCKITLIRYALPIENKYHWIIYYWNLSPIMEQNTRNKPWNENNYLVYLLHTNDFFQSFHIEKPSIMPNFSKEGRKAMLNLPIKFFILFIHFGLYCFIFHHEGFIIDKILLEFQNLSFFFSNQFLLSFHRQW